MSVDVPSRALVVFGGHTNPPGPVDLDALFEEIEGNIGVEWNPFAPEQLDVRPSRPSVSTESTPDAAPTSPKCGLSRSRLGRYGQRHSRSSMRSETSRTPDRIDATPSTASERNAHAMGNIVSLSASPQQAVRRGARPDSPRPVARSDSRERAADVIMNGFGDTWPLATSPAAQAALVPLPTRTRASSTASRASYSTAAESPLDFRGSTDTRSRDQRLSLSPVSAVEFHGSATSRSATSSRSPKSPKPEGDDLFKRFKAAIRAKTKIKSKEWWEYENPASLERIRRAQNALLPVPHAATGTATSTNVEPPSPSTSKAAQVAPLRVSPPPSRPPPSVPQPQASANVEALEQQIAALQKQIADFQQERLEFNNTSSNDRTAPPAINYVECSVCGDTLPQTLFVGRITAKCSHATHTCRDCTAHWIAACLEARGWDHINCPECPEMLDTQDVKQSAEAETFIRYDALATRSYLSTLPDFRWCTAPGCGSGQLHPESTGPLFKCCACGHKICIKHNLWHGGETCKEYEYRTGLDGGKKVKEEAASEKKLKELTKACPGPRCGWRIEKNKGCDHMTCRKCKYEFCWICMADYREIRTKGNTAHRRSCKYHSDNID